MATVIEEEMAAQESQQAQPPVVGPDSTTVVGEEMARQSQPDPTIPPPSMENLDPQAIQQIESEGFVPSMSRVAQGMIDEVDAMFQQTSPIVRDIDGKLLRPLASYDIQRTFEETNQIPPQGYVVLRDQDGILKVFETTPETEGPLEQAALTLKSENKSKGMEVVRDVLAAAGRTADFSSRAAALGSGSPSGAIAHAAKQTPVNFSRAVRELANTRDVSERTRLGGTGTPISGTPAGSVTNLFGLNKIQDRFRRTALTKERFQISDEIFGNGAQDTINDLGKIIGTAQDDVDMGDAIKTASGQFRTRLKEFGNKTFGAFESKVPSGVISPMDHTRKWVGDFIQKMSGTEDLGTLSVPRELESLAALFGPRGQQGMTWSQMHRVRSKFGELQAGGVPEAQGMAKGEYRKLYDRMTKDMEEMADQYGFRRQFDRTNKAYTKGMEDYGEVLSKLEKGGEKAFNEVKAFTSVGPSADTRAFEIFKRNARRGPAGDAIWGDYVATTLNKLGLKPVAGEGDQFDLNTFMDSYNKITRTGKGLLLGPPSSPLRREMDDLARAIASRQREIERGAEGSTSVGVLYQAAVGTLWNGLAAATGNGRLLTDPRAVKLFRTFLQASEPSARGRRRVGNWTRNLQRMIQSEEDPGRRAVLESFRSFAGSPEEKE